jgi:hypothetical protein
MKKYFFRSAVMLFLTALTLLMLMTRTTVRANASVPAHVSGNAGHENNQNNWGLFGIIGVIALAGITKRNVLQKNE